MVQVGDGLVLFVLESAYNLRGLRLHQNAWTVNTIDQMTAKFVFAQVRALWVVVVVSLWT